MKNEQTAIPMDSSIDKAKKFIKYGLILSATAVVIIGVGQYSNAKEEYKPLTPQAEQTWKSMRQTLCESEKALAQAKIMDVANGVKMEADLNALNAKRNMTCDFLKPQQ